MGKVKKRSRNSKRRINPTSRPYNQNQDKDEQTRQSKILPLIEKLSSPIPNDRSVSLNAITAMCENSKLREMLLKEKLVKILLDQMITDSNHECVVEAFGLLRNLTLDEGYDVSIYLLRQGILINISNSIDQIIKSFEVLASGINNNNNNNNNNGNGNDIDIDIPIENAFSTLTKKSDQTLLFDYAENIISLVITLSNSVENPFLDILKKLPKFQQFLIDIYNWGIPINSNESLKIPQSLISGILEAFYIMTELFEYRKNLNQSKYDLNFINEKIFKTLPQYLSNLSKVYIQGIQFNLYFLDNKNKNKNKNKSKNKNINQLNQNELDLKEISILKELSILIKLIDINKTKSILNPDIKDSIESIDDSIVRKTAISNLNSIEESLELITAIIQKIAVSDSFTIPEELESIETEVTTMEEDLEMKDQEIEEQKDFENQEDESQVISVSTNVSQFILETLMPIVVSLLQHEDLLLSRTLICLNNLTWLFTTSSSNNSLWKQASRELWPLIINTMNNMNENSDDDIITGTFGVLWALAKTLKGDVPINEEFVKGIIKLSEVCNLRDNIEKEEKEEIFIRSIGLLGSLALKQGQIHITQIIGDYFFNLLDNLSIESVLIIIEILNNIFDIFGDKNFDYDKPVFIENNYLERLKSIQLKVKTCVRKIDKRKYPDLRSRGNEAAYNLSRFIEYKEHE